MEKVDRVAAACREAYAEHNGDVKLGLIPWRKARPDVQEAWRVVARVAIKELDSFQ